MQLGKTPQNPQHLPLGQMLKFVGIILGVIGILVFGIYYQYAFSNMPNLNYTYSDFVNCYIYLLISYCFYAMGQNEKPIVKYLVYYSISEFWFFLSLTYVVNILMDSSITMHKVIVALFLTFFASLLWYFLRLFLHRLS